MRAINHIAVESLLMDESFYQWYCRTDRSVVQKWQQWIHSSPKNEKLVKEAIQLLSLMLQSEKMPVISEQQIIEHFNRLTQTLEARKKYCNSRLN